MPVRIYDIAKKLGVESKDVLTKAKELGIAGARVPSSSLDKITAEYLESHFTPATIDSHAPPPPLAPEPVLLVTAPPEPPEPAEPPAEPVLIVAPPEVVTAPESALPLPIGSPASPLSAPVTAAPPVRLESSAPPAPAPPAPPAPPAVPGLGQLVGRVQLPSRPAPRGSLPGRSSPPPRPGQPAGRPPSPGFGRPGTFAPNRGSAVPPKPVAPAEPKVILPADSLTITIKPPIIVRDLAEKLGRKPFQLIADLIELKVMANVNQAIDEAIATRLCAKYGFRFEVEKRERGGGIVHAPKKPVEVDLEDKPEDMTVRAPVVTIMGHVDHGKTTLLDVIRKANVASGEAGGITQHIGAYTIAYPHPERKGDLRQITFLDTPGHAAFSAMRARGANVTDIVVLVVAANDGVMPQTLEALSHAQAARVPIIVAVNKCDHPNANPMRVRQQLQERGLVPDDWGGNTTFVDVSALTKQGVDHLLELILLQADLMELRANSNRSAKGNVVESGLEQGGPTATVLVRKGTLRVGHVIVCGQYWGKVRALIDEEGERLKEAGPSVAVRVLGLNGVPEAGLEFSAVDNDKLAREISEQREHEAKEQSKEKRSQVTLENLFAQLESTQAKVLRLVVKADMQGSVEAIVEALKKIETDKVLLEIVHSAVGTVTENDVLLASASKAVVLGFHTRIDGGVNEAAKREGVQIKLYAIIYELIDQVKESMAGMLDPILKENVIGVAEVRKVFELSKGGNIAGCVIASGRITKGKIRVMRRKSLLYEGVIQSLRRFQDEVNDVRAGMECGIRVDGFNEFQIGDTIEAYTIEKVVAKL